MQVETGLEELILGITAFLTAFIGEISLGVI